MKLSKLAILPVGMAMLMTAGLSQAIEVFPIVKEIKQETPRDNFITVKSMYRAVDSVDVNKSENKSYEFVTLELFHITNPGDTKENKVKEHRCSGSDVSFFTHQTDYSLWRRTQSENYAAEAG